MAASHTRRFIPYLVMTDSRARTPGAEGRNHTRGASRCQVQRASSEGILVGLCIAEKLPAGHAQPRQFCPARSMPKTIAMTVVVSAVNLQIPQPFARPA